MPGMPKYLDDLCDNVDAAVFSGDSLYNRQAFEEFKAYLARWEKELVSIENTIVHNEAVLAIEEARFKNNIA